MIRKLWRFVATAPTTPMSFLIGFTWALCMGIILGRIIDFIVRVALGLP